MAGSAATDLAPPQAVTMLTAELFDYAEQVARDLEQPLSELWAVALTVSGRMSYPWAERAAAERLELGVPDSPLGSGLTRFELWRTALGKVLELLGDPEARFRTGYDSAELMIAVDEFFTPLPATRSPRSTAP